MDIKEYSAKSEFIDVQGRKIRFLASAGDVDRDNEKILPSAFKEHLEHYLSNPVIIAGHQYRLGDGSPSVIGRATKVWVDEQGLWIICEFARTELAEQFWQLYGNGFMKGCSIGFVPLSWHNETANGEQVKVYDRVELLEVSLVSIPSNRQALARSKQKKLDFAQNKKREKDEDKILEDTRKEYAALGRDFDLECAQFSEAILCGDFEGGHEISEVFFDSLEDYGKYFSTKNRA